MQFHDKYGVPRLVQKVEYAYLDRTWRVTVFSGQTVRFFEEEIDLDTPKIPSRPTDLEYRFAYSVFTNLFSENFQEIIAKHRKSFLKLC